MSKESFTPWHRQGVDPDYRFSLANERTFLAWVRTTLAVVATAIVFDQIAAHVASPMVLRRVALLLAMFGLALAIGAYFRWRANEAAMRLQRPLQVSKALAVVAGAVSATSAAVVFWLLQ
ncbi:DUF202 domain-containing protein [Achromobacter mucicolens]|uniref:YidH family protein n=1 Tax=Achromobacter mucicolens TaxID=1389922 RepID=UPI00244A659A|nr:DUF202 domain-containing protein [Achromobacter mucicolens]MDH0092460.1 DUF202 domain-containing protein [Achromobacter mucicolens]